MSSVVRCVACARTQCSGARGFFSSADLGAVVLEVRIRIRVLVGVVITDDAERLASVLEKNTGQRQQALEPTADRDPPLPGALAQWLAERETEIEERGGGLPAMTSEPTDPEVLEGIARGREQLGLDADPDLDLGLADQDPDPDPDLEYDGPEIG